MSDSTMVSCLIIGTNLDPVSLSNITISTNLPYIVSSNDVVWQLGTIDGVAGAVIYDTTGLPISFIDFGTLRSAYNGTVSLPLSNGFIQIP